MLLVGLAFASTDVPVQIRHAAEDVFAAEEVQPVAVQVIAVAHLAMEAVEEKALVVKLEMVVEDSAAECQDSAVPRHQLVYLVLLEL